MHLSRAAEIQVVLEGIRLPASRDELIAYAAREDPDAARELRAIPDGEYERLDDVGEALAPTQPSARVEQLLPWPESGSPPGGEDYVNPRPESGKESG